MQLLLTSDFVNPLSTVTANVRSVVCKGINILP